MKIITLLLILVLLNTLPLLAQTNCQSILTNARNAAAKGNYKEAIDKYTTAVDCDRNLSSTANIEIKAMFDKINKLKTQAEQAETKAKNALKTAEQEKQNAKREKENALQKEREALQAKTQADTSAAQAKRAQTETKTALQKAQKLIDAFYFYDGKFALAYKQEKFYFIDKNGNTVDKLGKWDKAEPFDHMGLAKVVLKERNNIVNYLLDTLSNTYSVAYDLKDLNIDITALDLRGQNVVTLPDSIGKYVNLKILLLSNTRLSDIPKFIEQLSNLEVLDLQNLDITKLPANICRLKKLQVLNLSTNKISILPDSIGQLTNLEWLLLGGNSFLTALPKSMVQLVNLKKIYLYNSFKLYPYDKGYKDEELKIFLDKLNSGKITFDSTKWLTEIYIKHTEKIKADSTNFMELAGLGFLAIALNKPQEAVATIQKALVIGSAGQTIRDDEQAGIELLLAFSYLFNNQYSEAEKIFLKWKYYTFPDGTKSEIEIDSLMVGFERRMGITHPDFAKVRLLLEER